MQPFLSRAWHTSVAALRRFTEIDGTARGAAFAYYAFFSLFPLIVLFVAVGSLFVDRQVAVETVIGYAEKYVPLESTMKRTVFDTITGVVETRGRVGVIASIVLLWASLRFFRALVRGTNRAWSAEMHNWWQMPLKSLQLLAVLGSALLLGLIVPAGAKLVQQWLPAWHGLVNGAVNATIAIVPTLILFYGLALFYRLAPRRPTRFSEVWPAALGATLLLRLVEALFLLYLHNFGKFNVVYGTFAGVMALLMWIYLSGCIVVFGACVSAVQVETADQPRPTDDPNP
jgi:YihY family inner membrane protein